MPLDFGMSCRRQGLSALVAALVLTAGALGCRKQPDVPLELKLTLVRTKLKPHDAIWYVLEAKNIGLKPLMILDEFWREQRYFSRNCALNAQTMFEIIGPDGKEIPCNLYALGDHGEFDFWANSRGTFKMELGAGESTTATPSIIAPVRGNAHRDFRTGPSKARRLEWSKSLKRDQERAGEKEWPEWARVPFERPVWAPADARILVGYDVVAPGKYRIRAVYRSLPEAYVAEQKKAGRKDFPGFPPETRSLTFQSPWSEFEVSP